MSNTEPSESIEEIRISSDSHVSEPPELWEVELPAKFRDRAPRFPRVKRGVGLHARTGGWDPVERLKDMAADGISAEVLYPTLAKGIFEFAGKDPELAQACDRVYNDWMIDFCKAAPDRLWGQAHICLWNMDYAVAELERCKDAGLPGATIWIIPPEGLPFASDHYERFWSAAEELATPISMHINSGFGIYLERHFEDRVGTIVRQSFGHKTVAMQALAELILSGALERHPRLKLVIAEYEVGWIPFWLEDLDRKMGRSKGVGLPLQPSAYFNRQIYATFMQDGVGGYLLQRWGADNFLWSNDYPHGGGIWPFSDDVIDNTLGHLSAQTRAKVVGQNVARVYDMPIPKPMPRQPAPDTDVIWKRPWLKRRGFTFDKPTMGL